MAVAFVAAGTTYSATSGGTGFTLNKPAGVAAGDRMYATVVFWTSGGQRTVSCTGWTVVKTAYYDAGSDEVQVTVLTRVVEASDPASWTASASATVYLRLAAVVAYSGVQQLGNTGTSSTGGGSSLATATINNDVTNSWRLVAGAYFSGTDDYNISSNETSRRWITSADNSGATQAAVWDSNGGIATGNTSRTVSRSANWTCAASVILLLEPATGDPASGDMASTLPAVSSEADGEVHDDATVAMTLPAASFSGDGYGQPPTVDGPLDASLAPVVADVSAGTVVSGSVDATLPLSAEVVGETRFFGVRTVVVEADDRTIEVESRAVAD